MNTETLKRIEQISQAIERERLVAGETIGNQKGAFRFSHLIRQATIQSVGAASYACKLRNWNGSEWILGDEITVYVETVLGTNDFDGDVWPDFSAGITIFVIKDQDGKWYWPGVVDDTEECE